MLAFHLIGYNGYYRSYSWATVMKRRQIQFESDSDRDKELFRATMRALKDIALIIIIGIVSVIGMIWIAMDGQINNW